MQIATGSASVIERNGITSRGRKGNVADNPSTRGGGRNLSSFCDDSFMIRDARIKGMWRLTRCFLVCFVSLTIQGMMYVYRKWYI